MQALVDDKNEMKEELTTILVKTMDGRTSFQAHESILLDRMVAIEPPTLHATVVMDGNTLKEELTKILTPALKGRKKLEDHEERLLGQLAVIAFGKRKDAEQIELKNFTNCRKISLACVPGQYKEREEMDNKNLFFLESIPERNG